MRESLVRDHFARQHDGRIEVPVRFGRCDVVTKREAVEVEPVDTWQHGARQAMAYAHQLKRLPAIAIYGEMSKGMVRKMARRCKGVLELYVLDGSDWHVVPGIMAARSCRLASHEEAATWPTLPVSTLKGSAGYDSLGRPWIIEEEAA